MNTGPSHPIPELSALRIARDREPSSRRLRWVLLAAGALILATAAAYFWISANPQVLATAAPVFAAVSVEKTAAAVVTEGQALTLLSATGHVEAETRADLSPRITSRVTELRVTEGSRVKKGEVIARLDHTDLDAQLADARAAWIDAESELKRQRSLHEQGLGPRSQLDRAVAAEASAPPRVNYEPYGLLSRAISTSPVAASTSAVSAKTRIPAPVSTRMRPTR